MAYYDPIQQAQVANVFAAQYGVQREAEEEKKAQRNKGLVAGLKAGFYLDRGYRQDQTNKAAEMLQEESALHEGGKKYVRKPYKKPESWREWLSQRYATPLGTEKGPGSRGALLQEAGYIDKHPEVQRQIKGLVGPDKTHILGKSGEVGPLSDPDTRHGKFDPEQYKTKMETESIIHNFQQSKDTYRDPTSKEAIKEIDDWHREAKGKVLSNADTDFGVGAGPQTTKSTYQKSMATLKDAETRLTNLKQVEKDLTQNDYTFRKPLVRYKQGAQGPNVADFQALPETQIQDQDNLKTIQQRWGFGKQTLGNRRSVKGMQLPESDQPQVQSRSASPDFGLRPGAGEAGFAAAPSDVYTDLREMPLADYEMNINAPIQKTPFIRGQNWQPSEANIQRAGHTYGLSEPTAPALDMGKRFEQEYKNIKAGEIAGTPPSVAPAVTKGADAGSALKNYGPVQGLQKEQLGEWLEAGGSKLPGKTDLGKYGNWLKTTEASTDAATAATDAAVDETIGVSDVGAGLKVGATLLGSQGMSGQELANTGLEAGLDYASTKAITSGNPYLMAAGGAYKLWNMVT